MTIKYRVRYTESERGWGQDSWNTDYPTESEAIKQAEETNAKNTARYSPDWYMQAEYLGPVDV